MRLLVRTFADVEAAGTVERWWGSTESRDCEPNTQILGDDPGRRLLKEAADARAGLGPLLGDLRIAGYDITRWEFYSAPTCIELSEALRTRLAGSWYERDPR